MPDESNQSLGPKYEAQVLFVMEDGHTEGHTLTGMKAREFDAARTTGRAWANDLFQKNDAVEYMLAVFERGRGEVSYSKKPRRS